MFSHFTAFYLFKYVPATTDCVYSAEMKKKSEILTMPVLLDDVDVLDQLEKWTYDIYSAAGLCSAVPADVDDTTPQILTRSWPDQPASHVPPTRYENDPLCGVKIPSYGDQLTRLRFAGA